MSVPVVLTREYLQGLPEANRLKKIKEEEDRKAKTVTAIVEYFRGSVLDAASKEKTSYLVEGSNIEELRNINSNHCGMNNIEELRNINSNHCGMNNNNTYQFRQMLQRNIFTNKFTDEDVVAAFQAIFPDCKVTYEEQWVGTGRYTQVLKTGIMIDWS
jgi:hypothetical protein